MYTPHFLILKIWLTIALVVGSIALLFAALASGQMTCTTMGEYTVCNGPNGQQQIITHMGMNTYTYGGMTSSAPSSPPTLTIPPPILLAPMTPGMPMPLAPPPPLPPPSVTMPGW